MSPLGRRETRDLLSRHGLRPRTSLGQHFLVDPNTIRKIVRVAAIRTGELVVEIGAGVGALTLALAGAGAEVIAIEQDRGLDPALTESLAEVPNVTVVWVDALAQDYDRLLGGRPARVVANLPYQIATPLVLRLLEDVPSVTELMVMVQEEVGDRFVADPGGDAYGAVSAKIAYLSEASVAFKVSREVFMPKPDVESVVVRLTRRSPPPVAGDRGRIFAVIDAGFATRRKTLRNALRGAGLDSGVVEEALAAADVDRSARAEQLGLSEFAAIARVLEVPEVRR
ncbi:MAG: 16S rRNA (adenine(1518)-N(6)/adenine(1519)-N(6))-dimethyltransferase RsmA [Actinomycetota bacterium]